ncbi:Dynamin [Folsomia candida]|uniref:Dynamin n=1 Tax=Folsomia candida TaxID=158441 RepID=A0A226D2Q7_FOLCA|nr:Dynamin [Folsomia candida]
MAREKEQVFFAERREFDHLAGKLGTRYLSSVMDELLRMKIISSLKGLKADIVKGLEEATCKIEELTPLCSASHQQDLQVSRLMDDIINSIIVDLTGNTSTLSPTTTGYSSGSKITKMVEHHKEKLHSEIYDISEETIGYVIVNSAGVNYLQYNLNAVLQKVVHDELAKLVEPTTAVIDEAKLLIGNCCNLASVKLSDHPVYLNPDVVSDASPALKVVLHMGGSKVFSPEEFILENMPDTDDLSRYQMLQQTCVQSMGHISNLRAARRSK